MKKSLLFSGLIVAMTLLCCYALVTADVVHQKRVVTPKSVLQTKAPAAATVEKVDKAAVSDPKAGLSSGAKKTAALPVPKAEKLDQSPIATRPGSTVTKAPVSNEPAYLNDPDYLRKLEKEELAKPYMGTLDGLLNCSSPISIACGGSYTGNNSGYPSNVSRYSCTSWNESGPEVLFSLTIPSRNIIVATLSGMSADLDVFILSICDEGYCIAFGDVTATTSCQPAGTYYIVVDGYNGAVSPFTLTVTCTDCGGGAPNDECWTAIQVAVPSTTSGTTVGANNTCGYSGMDVFYYFVLSECRYVAISLCNTADPYADTHLWLYLGAANCCGTSLYNSDGGCDNTYNRSRIPYTTGYVTLQPGTYYINVDWWGGGSGPFVLDVLDGGACEQTGPEDECAGAIVIPSLPYTDTKNTCLYTNTCANASEDLFYKYTVQSPDEYLTISLCGSSYDTYLWVWSECCVSLLASNDDYCDLQSQIEMCFQPGDIWIQVEGYDGAGFCGTAILNVTSAGPCPVAPECPPGSLFAQDPTDAAGSWTAYTSDNNPTWPFWFMVFDNFWGVTSYVCDLHWWGLMLNYNHGWFDCRNENPMTFDIAFYMDAAGMPGAQVAAFTIPVTGVNTGIYYAGFPMWYFSTTLSPCVGLTLGWLSIQGVSTASPECSFLWMNSPYGDLNSYQFDGTTMDQLDDDLAFCLTGEGQLIGACCDPYTGNCVDNVPADQCPAPSLFYANTACVHIQPPCGLGACCDPVTGECTQTTQANCTGIWMAGVPCDPNPCPPPNDLCSDAITLVVNDPNPTCANNSGATGPDCPEYSYPDLWYTFTLTEACADLVIEWCGTTLSGSLVPYLYDDCNCTNPMYRTSHEWDTCPDGLISLHWTPLPAGTYYYPFNTDGTGDFCIRVACAGAPNCMPCEAAIPMSGFVYDHSFTTCEWMGMPQTCLVGCHPFELNCGGIQYYAGPKIFYVMNLVCQTTVDILCTPSPTMDPQLMVFTVCPTIGGDEDCMSCVASSDTGASPWDGMPERIITTIGPGVYYLSVDCYQNAGPFSCGAYDLHVTSTDCPLPVELTSLEAIAGDREVALRWTTASEQDNASFDVQRKTASSEWTTVGQVNGAGNSQTPTNYSYTDRAVVNGVAYTYRLISRDINGTTHEFETTVEATPGAPLPTEYALNQNYPNPFNPQTSITYAVKEAGFVTLKVYNLIGQEVATLVSAKMEAGRYTAAFTATDLPSGVYVYRLEVNDFTAQKKMVLLK